MLARDRGTRRSCSTSIPFDRDSSRKAPIRSSPTAPCVQTLVDEGSSDTASINPPSLGCFVRIRSSRFCDRRRPSARAEAPATPRSSSVSGAGTPTGTVSAARGVGAWESGRSTAGPACASGRRGMSPARDGPCPTCTVPAGASAADGSGTQVRHVRDLAFGSHHPRDRAGTTAEHRTHEPSHRTRIGRSPPPACATVSPDRRPEATRARRAALGPCQGGPLHPRACSARVPRHRRELAFLRKQRPAQASKGRAPPFGPYRGASSPPSTRGCPRPSRRRAAGCRVERPGGPGQPPNAGSVATGSVDDVDDGDEDDAGASDAGTVGGV